MDASFPTFSPMSCIIEDRETLERQTRTPVVRWLRRCLQDGSYTRSHADRQNHFRRHGVPRLRQWIFGGSVSCADTSACFAVSIGRKLTDALSKSGISATV